MISVGDVVKVIKATEFNGEMVMFYPIGTVCRVVEKDVDGALGIIPFDNSLGSYPFYYLENEVEKGHLEWVTEV